MGPKVDVDILEMGKISCPYQELNPKLYSPQPSYYTKYTVV